MPKTHQWTVFVNPSASAGKLGRRWAALSEKLLATELVADVHLGDNRESMIDQVQSAIVAGARHLLAIGGDGTIHTVANVILDQQQVPLKDLTLAVYPFGSGNDWIRSHGIPTRWTDWKLMLEQGNTRIQSVGQLHYHTNKGAAQRYFVNVAGLAYDGFVVRETERHRRRYLPAKIYYLLMILRSLWSYKLQAAKLTWSNGTMTNNFYTINAGIGRYSGGGMQLCPHADPQSDQLAITTAGPLSKIAVLFNSWRFYTARVGDHPKVDCWHTKHITVRSTTDQPILLEADGEFLGHGPVRIEIIPDCLRVVVP